MSRCRLRLAILAGLAIAAAWPGSDAGAALAPIANDAVWTDTSGAPVRAQGGSMMKIGDTFHWYGFDGELPPPHSGLPMYRAVRCYTSRDLSHWTCAGDVLSEHVPNRVDVLYNPATRLYVMFTKEMDDAAKLAREGRQAGVGYATCATPTGHFTWQGRFAIPESIGGGDQSVFLDDDGKAYLVYTTWRSAREPNKDLICAELVPDFLSVARVVHEFPDTHLEAPAIFKRDGRYYWCASDIAWWYSSRTSWSTATSLAGPWTPFRVMTAKRPAAHPLAQQMLRDSYNSQHDFVVQVRGATGSFFMYCGDRYSQFTTIGAGYVVWLPLQFDGEAPQLDWYRTWYVDAAAGTWSAQAAAP